MWSPERTQKWREDFEDNEWFIEYCKKVSLWLYNIYIKTKKKDLKSKKK